MFFIWKPQKFVSCLGLRSQTPLASGDWRLRPHTPGSASPFCQILSAPLFRAPPLRKILRSPLIMFISEPSSEPRATGL